MVNRASDVPVPHLRDWRAYRELTQKQLAEAARVSRGTVLRAENGYTVNAVTLRRLARALRIRPGELLSVPPDLADVAERPTQVVPTVPPAAEEIEEIPTQPPADEWEALVAATVEGMRAAGVSEEAVAATVAHIRRRQRGDSTIEHHVIAEHTAPAAPASEALDASPPEGSVVEQRPDPARPVRQRPNAQAARR